MANKDVANHSLSSILAAKGITAKPGVPSAGNKATQRADDFKAGKTYTPAASKNLVAGNPQMRTSVGAGGRVGLSPARASMGFPNSAPPTSINAPITQRGAPAGPQQGFLPSSFPSGAAPSSGGGLGSYLQQNGPTNFLGLGGGLSPQTPSPMSADGWPTGDQNRWGQGGPFTPQAQAEPGRRWGGLGQAPRESSPDPISWIVNALWSMYGK